MNTFIVIEPELYDTDVIVLLESGAEPFADIFPCPLCNELISGSEIVAGQCVLGICSKCRNMFWVERKLVPVSN